MRKIENKRKLEELEKEFTVEVVKNARNTIEKFYNDVRGDKDKRPLKNLTLQQTGNKKRKIKRELEDIRDNCFRVNCGTNFVNELTEFLNKNDKIKKTDMDFVTIVHIPLSDYVGSVTKIDWQSDYIDNGNKYVEICSEIEGEYIIKTYAREEVYKKEIFGLLDILEVSEEEYNQYMCGKSNLNIFIDTDFSTRTGDFKAFGFRYDVVESEVGIPFIHLMSFQNDNLEQITEEEHKEIIAEIRETCCLEAIEKYLNEKFKKQI